MAPLCQITFVVLLISVFNVDLFLNDGHEGTRTGTLVVDEFVSTVRVGLTQIMKAKPPNQMQNTIINIQSRVSFLNEHI